MDVTGMLCNGWLLRMVMALVVPMLVTACEPSEESRRQKQIQHEDSIVPGESLPKYDYKRYSITKMNGRFFLIPREYGGDGALIFYWPSKTPMAGRLDGKPFPEQGLGFYDIAIEVFLRADRNALAGSESIFEQAERSGWIQDRKVLRKGLEVVTLNEKAGVITREKSLYLATEMKWPDGRIPVVECSDSLRTGGGWMPWRPGVFLTIRFKEDKCQDWPEIYAEILSVMSQVREIK